MKRSEINRIIQDGITFLNQMRFRLPPFAFWTPDDWRRKGPECREIAERRLGWDVTDFGSGDFARTGLFLFTLRNGAPENARRGEGKLYCEKIMIVRERQVTPAHFHFVKTEDIIVRGGGDLVIHLWNSDEREGVADSDVTVSVDGVLTTVPAGGAVVLKPGESVTLPQRLYHTFWAREGGGDALVGEVSLVNDDHTDNRFLAPIGRFSVIEEDAPLLHLLCNDYERYYRQQ